MAITFSPAAFERELAARGLSPAELSRLAGIAEEQISRYRCGREQPRPATIARLANALSPEVAAARGYFTATTRVELERLGFSNSQRNVPALVIPVYGVADEPWTYQARPDRPRVKNGKALKYETPLSTRMALDVPRP